MKLSNLGRVVIIDDEYKDVVPLFHVLSKKNIPFIYYDGKKTSLPSKPIIGIRFVFMDIELGKGFAGQEIKTKASGVTAVLQRIISQNNGPYVLIAWTKHGEVIAQVVENCESINISPVKCLNLEKLAAFNSNDVIKYITVKLEEVLANIGAFQLYVDWENMLNTAAKEFISIFSGFFPMDSKWSKNTEFLFYKLYKTYVEKNELEDKNEKLKCAMYLLNRSYNDTLSNFTSNYKVENTFALNSGKIEEEVIRKLNSLLFFIDKPNLKKSPGSIYSENNPDLLKGLIDNCLQTLPDSNPDIKLCKMIITPECDIAQKKLLLHRYVYGIMLEIKPEINFNHGDHLFFIGPFDYNNAAYKIILNFQTIMSQIPSKTSDRRRLFAIKKDLLFDIQSKAANHVNRLGNYQLR